MRAVLHSRDGGRGRHHAVLLQNKQRKVQRGEHSNHVLRTSTTANLAATCFTITSDTAPVHRTEAASDSATVTKPSTVTVTASASKVSG